MIFSDQGQRDLLTRLSANPLPALPPTFGERFHADYEAGQRFDGSVSQARNLYDATQKHLDAYEALSGEPLANPEAAPLEGRDRLRQQNRAQVDAWNQKNPDRRFDLPGDDAISVEAESLSRGAREESRRLGEGPQTFAGSVGGFLGGAGSAIADPVNAASMLAGAPEAAAYGILRTAAVEAGIAAGSQTAIEALTAPYKQRIDPSFGLGEAAGNVVGAAVGGAVIGGGLKALTVGVRKILGKNAPAPDVADALKVAERTAEIDEKAPVSAADAEGIAAHRASLTKAMDAVERGEPVNVASPHVLEAESELTRWAQARARVEREGDALLTQAEREGGRGEARRVAAEQAGGALESLRGEADALRVELDVARGRAVEAVDAVTQERLTEIDAELAAPALPRARREALQAEQRMLREGRPETDALERARAEAEVAGLERATRQAETRAARAEAVAQRAEDRALEAALQADRAFRLQATKVDARTALTRDLAERTVRRFARRAGVDLGEEEVQALARRALSSPDEIRNVIGEVVDRARPAEEVPVRVETAEEPAAPAEITAQAPAKAVVDAKSHDAVHRELDDLLANRPDFLVPTDTIDAEGNIIMRSLADVLKEADDGIRQAREIAACALGGEVPA